MGYAISTVSKSQLRVPDEYKGQFFQYLLVFIFVVLNAQLAAQSVHQLGNGASACWVGYFVDGKMHLFALIWRKNFFPFFQNNMLV